MEAPKPPAKSRLLLWGRIAVWSVAFAGVAWGGVEVHSFLLRDPRFHLENLEIHGAVYTNTARLQSVFAADFGRSVFQIPLAERRRHLLAVDWVRTAAVTRVWPNRIIVKLTERRPVAFAKLPMAGSIRHWMALTDRDGVLLSIPPRVRFRLPVLTGLNEEQTDEERRIRVEAMEHLLSDLGPQAKDISEINASGTQDLRVIASVGGKGVELILGDQHYRSRYLNFLSHYDEIRRHSERASMFDLRIDDRISAR
ncbi:MAG: FtsQ-type POTRA domain-containing protein [Acidobacteriota bacterium]|nr:FtsQ-type POTRA domain-containing protein [Acidobacteriota bacterium]